MKSEKFISRLAFCRRFRAISNDLYARFCAKISQELEPQLDKGVVIQSIGVHSSWKDAGGNTHCSLKGLVKRINETGKVHGEIVLLRKSKIFRGWVLHDLAKIDDWEYIQRARESFKHKDYPQCLKLLSLVTYRISLSRANIKMEQIAKERTSNNSM